MTDIEHLRTAFPSLEFQPNWPLAQYTTVGIGGSAEIFCQTSSAEELEKVVLHAIAHTIPYTILGWGANSLISDQGIKGLVIRNTSTTISLGEQLEVQNKNSMTKPVKHRWESNHNQGTFTYEFNDLDYDESGVPQRSVIVDSGVPLGFAITYTIQQGLTGLQWYSRIPATMGGAIYNNIHGGTHFISELVQSVTVITPQGAQITLPASELEFGYDMSRFHHSREVITRVTLNLYQGDVAKARQVVLSWAQRKALQPPKSLGCVFQNITPEEAKLHNLPTTSVGYIIEHVLGKKGWQVGDAQVSPKHAAFIENKGKATAQDYLHIVKTIMADTKSQLGITLKPEIFFLGFDEYPV